MTMAIQDAMTTLDKLGWLQANAHEFSIEVNEHRAYYDPIEKAVAEQAEGGFIDEAMAAECIARKQMVVVQCYPFTPIGFFRVVDYDIARAIERTYVRAFADLGEKGGGR